MDMNNFRGDQLHVAQQSRRDKLRNTIPHDHQSNNQPHHHLGSSIYFNNLEQLPSRDVAALNYESAANLRNSRAGNICYNPSQFISSDQMLNFSMNSNSEPHTTYNPSATVSSSSNDPQHFSTWKSINDGSQSATYWVANNQTPSLVGYDLAGDNINSCNSSMCQNALQEVVASPTSNELVLHPAYTNTTGCHQWSARELRQAANDHINPSTQTLSLSLSSVPSPRVHATQIPDRETAVDLLPRDANVSTNNNVIQEYPRIWKPVHYSASGSNLPAGGGGRVSGSSLQETIMMAQALTQTKPGPLGPFTGYATILRSSKFLRPAQQLLDELCSVGYRPKHVGICEALEEVRVSSSGEDPAHTTDHYNQAVHAVKEGIACDSSGSSFAFNGSDDKDRAPRETGCSTDLRQPENQHKKAKLLLMQDEVCKRYKQYHQQMQMAVSSFESVAGLSAATPYISLALKVVSKHFRCLKNAIMDQLKGIRNNAFGEELSSPSAGTTSSKGNVSMLKLFDQSFMQKQKATAGTLGILDGQHIWRPQRGLPERAVSILRAWLFDHFLHPYPTDTDKHMLATQTGLTRNQVSNWFINARVRVWKPMVEEIHMLETKGTVDRRVSDITAATDKTKFGKTTLINEATQDWSLNNLRMISAIQEKRQVEPSNNIIIRDSPSNTNVEWNNNQEKRSRMEYHEGSLMGSHRNGTELTLGLRQSVESNGQWQQEHQHRHLRTRFGGQMIIRDFVG